jgi:ribosome biogenesis GTPase / thiamine phosphate phosphatase
MQGTIVKGIAGFYYVKVENEVIECKARGKFRHTDLTPMVGDRVKITIKDNKGIIEEILKRDSCLLRPAVANVSLALIVTALKSPDVNYELLNRLLVLCEFNNIKAVVCFNKLDLVQNFEETEAVKMVKSAGYDVIYLIAKQNYGIEEVKKRLNSNITVLCGPSGAGKSTILNKIAGIELMETGIVSGKLGTGKHTTRHSELIKVADGFVVDTPGFSSLEIDFIEKDQLMYYFPEFMEYINDCKYSSCLHYKEITCAVKKAVEETKISKIRYDFYVKMLEEITNRRSKR